MKEQPLLKAEAPSLDMLKLAAHGHLLKAHVNGYTRKDGIFVSEHEDRRPSAKQKIPALNLVHVRGALMGMVAVPVSDSLSHLEGRALRDAAESAYRDAAKLGAVEMADGRKVSLTSVGLKKTRSHSGDRRVLDLLPAIRDVLMHAVPITSLPHEAANPGDSIRAWHYYGAKVSMGAAELYAKLVVRESVNGEIYYDNDLSSVEEISGRGGDAAPAKPEAAPVSADKRTLAELLAVGKNGP